MSNNHEPNVLVRVRNLKKYFPISKGTILKRHVGDVKAVDDVSFDIYEGETLGLVGESGCGKTTVGRTLLQIYQPTDGVVYFDGQDITKLKSVEMRAMRRQIQMIFQDPYASLNPRMTVGNIISEPMMYHKVITRAERDARVKDLLEMVGLRDYFAKRYPHEFSGGQRQRIGIARSIGLGPRFIVCDEPISALDVSIQAQIVNLLEELQETLGLTYLFIAHDLSMVRHISDRIAVMYLGKIVELTDRNELYTNPLHPYTKALLSAVPIPDPVVEEQRDIIELEGDVPSPSSPPEGCNFNTRCPLAEAQCFESEPPLIDAEKGHQVACYLVHPLTESTAPPIKLDGAASL